MPAVLKKAISLTACAARYWSSDNASTTGAALAFFCAFSLAPLLVIVLTLAGLIVGANAAYGQVGTQLNSLFGPSTAAIVLDAVKKAQQPQGLVATLVSVVTLLIGATTVLAAIEAALEQIWKSAAIAPQGVRGWLRTRFLSLGFILTLGFLLLVSLTVSTALAGIRGRIAASHAALVGALRALDFLVSLALVSALFALIYRYMPARRLIPQSQPPSLHCSPCNVGFLHDHTAADNTQTCAEHRGTRVRRHAHPGGVEGHAQGQTQWR